VLPSGGGLTKAGAGTLVLPNSNGYTGLTSINGGALQVSNGGALGTSTVVASAAVQLQLTNNITVTNPLRLTGSGLNLDGVLKNLSGNNTLTDLGVTAATGFRINVAAGSSLTVTNDLALGNGASAQNVRVIGAGTLQLDGDSSAVLAVPNSLLVGDGTNAGPTIKAGSNGSFGAGKLDLQANSASTIQSKDATTHSFSVALALNAATTTFGTAATGDLSFSGAVTLGTNVTAIVNNAVTTFSGSVGETGGPQGLTKAGNGRLVLGGNNTFSG
jgi:autotransporter-associated beta strand protein